MYGQFKTKCVNSRQNMKRINPLFSLCICMLSAQIHIQSLAKFETLPIALKREILRINFYNDGVLNIPSIANGITTLAATNKQLHKETNTPENILNILKSLPKPAALVLANGLCRMPGMKHDEVQEWLKSINLIRGEELFAAIHRSVLTESDLDNDIIEDSNCDINWRYPCSRVNTLMFACGEDLSVIVRRLLAQGAYVNAMDKDGWNALIYASHNGHLNTIQLLLAAGSHLNHQNKKRYTALMYASEHAHADVVRVLLAAGAQVLDPNNNVCSALDLAHAFQPHYPERANAYNEIIALLKKAKKEQKTRRAIP